MFQYLQSLNDSIHVDTYHEVDIAGVSIRSYHLERYTGQFTAALSRIDLDTFATLYIDISTIDIGIIIKNRKDVPDSVHLLFQHRPGNRLFRQLADVGHHSGRNGCYQCQHETKSENLFHL